AAWRAWIVAAACVVIRAAMLRAVPFEPALALKRTMSRVGSWARARRGDKVLIYFWILALSLWLASGPPFGLWPYVYWLPGFNFIRATSRFTLMGMVGLAMLTGAGFEALVPLGARRRIAAAVLVGALIFGECLVRLEGVEYRVDIPPADSWLATRPTPFVVAEV